MRDTGSTTKLDGSITYKFYGQYEEIVYSPGPRLCYVIVTARSFLWTLLTLGSTLIIVASVITPQWLIGKPKWIGLRSEKLNGSVYDYNDRTYKPTIGLFNRCTKIHHFGDVHLDNCATYVTGFHMPSDQFPDCWKSALILFAVAIVMLGVTMITALLSFCVRAVFRKSIFTVSGLVQAIAGLFLIVGLILYPLGWGAHRVRNLCGDHAAPFLIDDCQLVQMAKRKKSGRSGDGRKKKVAVMKESSTCWAFYTCIGGTILVFVAAMLSIQAELATSSEKVENEVLEGKRCVCVM